MITVGVGVSGEALLSRLDDVVHLPRAHVVQLPVAAAVVLRLHVGEAVVHGRAQQRGHVRLLSAMGVHLDEDPLRAALDVDAGLHPGIDALAGGRVVGAHVAVLDARDHTQLALLEVEGQRALQDHQVAAGRHANLHPNAVVVRARVAGVVLGVVDLVDRDRLAGVGGGRQGVVGVAALFAQDDEFVVDAAAAAVRVGVIEGPVAVDEGPAGLARHRVDRQRVVAVDQGAGEALQLLAQAGFGVVFVVKVDLDFAQAHAAQVDDVVEVLGAVFLFGVEEGVHRREAVGVTVLGAQLGVALLPLQHALALDLVGGSRPGRLVMVNEAEHQVAHGALRGGFPPVLLEPGTEPDADVAAAHFSRQDSDCCKQHRSGQAQSPVDVHVQSRQSQKMAMTAGASPCDRCARAMPFCRCLTAARGHGEWPHDSGDCPGGRPYD